MVKEPLTNETRYEVWWQNGIALVVIPAKNAAEARKVANRQLSFKKFKSEKFKPED